ncbi:polysaccharide biosynthesis tyrosine autokinase [Pseudarthrobacter oxydans]|nr:polysaccharide biosynthesis tyrosine autokinase [Pseudarthrobacter oxydans]NSX38685.1 polysaccharide biosynthesis tyrosine autokinase [Pseudarthrobacter oxydans]
MDLRDYLRIFRRNWITIVALALVGLLVGGAASLLIRPTYTASTQLFVAIQSSGTVTELQQGNTFSQARVQSYVKTVNSPIVLSPVVEALGLSASPDQLANRIEASSDPDTVLITIKASDASPAQAAAIAQAVGSSLVRAVDDLERPKAGGTSPVRLSIIAPAAAPVQPSAPNTKINLALGLLVGLGLGLAIAVLRTAFDTLVRGEAELRQVTDAPLLGRITFDPDATKKPLLTQTGIQSPRAEAFRQLRTNLQFTRIAGARKSVLVTSSIPGEGKSTTATNLALAVAQSGQSVCLVDADLRRPMVDTYLGLDRHAGLTTALIGEADLDDLLQPWGDDSFFVLTSGAIPPNPSELLGSEEMKMILSRLEDAFDFVILDAPPLLPVTDAAVLSQNVGGVVVVVGSQKTSRPELEKSLSALDLVGAQLLGLVLNRIPTKGADAYSYSYYSYESPAFDSERVSAEPDSSLTSRPPHEAERAPGIFPVSPRSEAPTRASARHN